MYLLSEMVAETNIILNTGSDTIGIVLINVHTGCLRNLTSFFH